MSLSITSIKIARSTIIQYTGKIVQLILAVITTKIITNYLSLSNYGKYAWVIEFCLFFSVAANLGLFANSIRKMCLNPTDGKLFVNALITRFFSAALFLIIAIIAALFVSGDKYFFIACIIFAVSLLFDFITTICDAFLQSNYLMGRATFAMIIGKIIQLLLAVTIINFLKIPPSDSVIPILMCIFLISSFITALISLFFVLQKTKIIPVFDMNLCYSLLKTGVIFGIINVINYLYFRFIPVALAKYILTDSQFGVFDISFRIAYVLSLFSTFFMFSVMPVFKQNISKKNFNFSYKLFKRALFILSGSAILLTGIGSWFGPFIIESLTHKSFILPEFWFIFPLFLILASVSYFYDLILITLFSIEHDKWLLKREIIAFTCAGVIFFCTFLISNLQLKVLIIIMGSITGETVVVTLGMVRIWSYFKEKLNLNIINE